MALRQIVAFGHTSVAKGCSDPANRGWLRSPLGGGSQNHYYLWWTRQGSPPIENLPIGRDDIIVRSVRHHDDHKLLVAGNIDDYLPIEREKLGEVASEFESPWNQEQLSFINSDEPVRLAIGRPGSGKTTVLWQSVDLRTSQDVLYVTWSQKLVEEAEKHFRAFAPNGTKILSFDFPQFLGKICSQDVNRQSLQISRENFERVLPDIRTAKLYGPWSNKTNALFAEIRAHLIGSINLCDVERSADSISINSILDSYSKDSRIVDRLGGPAVESLCNIVKEIEKVKPIVSLFPELDFSARAIHHLRSGNIPSGFDRITRIVVDEIQDLTLIELNVFLELSKAIQKANGRNPFMLLAGDEGQTVRPSGFSWGPTSDLISSVLGHPKSFQLQASVRYPGRIGAVLEKASSLYGAVSKGNRPRRQSRVTPDDYRQAQVLHVVLANQEQGAELLSKLVEIERVLVVTASESVPNWIRKDVGEGVLTPLESKGLEYETVCVVNPGAELVEIATQPKTSAERLETLHRRTRIDQLRVAMSRTTETLVFVDIGSSSEALARSRALLDEPASFEAADLIELLTRPEAGPDERVLNRINDALTLVEARPVRAWQLVVQAMDMLGEPGLHNGVTEPGLRKRTFEVVLSIASQLLVDGLPDGVNYNEIRSATDPALESLESEQGRFAFDRFAEWIRGQGRDPFNLLDAISDIDQKDNWLRSALSNKNQKLTAEIEDGALNVTTAGRFSGNVNRWLEFCGFTGDIELESNLLRRRAADTLLNHGMANFAESVLYKIGDIKDSKDKNDQIRIGKIRSMQDRWIEAAEAFELAGTYSDAVKNWRAAGKWDEARRVAQIGEIEDPDLDWLEKLEVTVNAMPIGLLDRLHDKEKTKLAELRKRMQITTARATK